PCCRHNSAVVNPASPCFRIAMICSSLCRVPFIAVLLSWVWENSHSRRSSFRGLRQNQHSHSAFVCRSLEGLPPKSIALPFFDSGIGRSVPVRRGALHSAG